MDANRDKRSVGQRWSEAQPTKTVAWCCVASAVLTMIVGFSWGGWVTGGTAGHGGDHGPPRCHAPGADLCRSI